MSFSSLPIELHFLIGNYLSTFPRALLNLSKLSRRFYTIYHPLFHSGVNPDNLYPISIKLASLWTRHLCRAPIPTLTRLFFLWKWDEVHPEFHGCPTVLDLITIISVFASYEQFTLDESQKIDLAMIINRLLIHFVTNISDKMEEEVKGRSMAIQIEEVLRWRYPDGSGREQVVFEVLERCGYRSEPYDGELSPSVA